MHEHGPRGGDELNEVIAGTNYGWPGISYGKEYWSPKAVGEGTHKIGMAQPCTTGYRRSPLRVWHFTAAAAFPNGREICLSVHSSLGNWCDSKLMPVESSTKNVSWMAILAEFVMYVWDQTACFIC
ncbi:MAG: hypothetical protein CM1200mP18_03550 [Gammaproteobacteria bacterium]|nr:MAG: hypothetical protein CM1200mP18_03550 [Gammaproteobacteria bacterium]